MSQPPYPPQDGQEPSGDRPGEQRPGQDQDPDQPTQQLGSTGWGEPGRQDDAARPAGHPGGPDDATQQLGTPGGTTQPGPPGGTTQQIRPGNLRPPPPGSRERQDTRRFDQPQFGQQGQQPQYGQPPQQGQPPYGAPPFGYPGYEQQPPAYGQQPPSYGQQPAYGQQPPPYGQPQYGQSPHYGQPPYGQPPYGQPGYGGPGSPGGPGGGGPGGAGGGSRRGKVIALVIAGVVVLAAVAAGLFFLLRNGDRSPTSTASETTTPQTSSSSAETSSPSSEPSGSPSRSSAPPPSGGAEDVPAGRPPGTLGDDPVLDGLADACFNQDWSACDNLYFNSDVGTEYESYGETCGGRNDPVFGACQNRYAPGSNSGIPADLPPATPAPTGTADSDVQAVADGCEQGIVAYCDILRLAALGGDPSLTPYGDYGRTCGGRNEPTETACVELYPV